MPIDISNLFYGIVNDDGTYEPIGEIKTLDIGSISDIDVPFTPITGTITVNICPANHMSYNKIIAKIYGFSPRIIHLMKYGKTKRVRKKNAKRIINTI